MAHYAVDSATLAATAAQTTQIASQIRAEVAAMMAALATLESSWTGQAQIAFADCAQRWHGAQTHVEDALTQIGAALQQASATYDDAEARAAGLFAG